MCSILSAERYLCCVLKKKCSCCCCYVSFERQLTELCSCLYGPWKKQCDEKRCEQKPQIFGRNNSMTLFQKPLRNFIIRNANVHHTHIFDAWNIKLMTFFFVVVKWSVVSISAQFTCKHFFFFAEADEFEYYMIKDKVKTHTPHTHTQSQKYSCIPYEHETYEPYTEIRITIK